MADVRWGAATDTGRLRPENEDNLLAADGVWVVADGMGGHEAGEVASMLAVERIGDDLVNDALPTAETVVESIGSANRDIFRAAIANPGQQGMGTTVTAIAVIADPMAGRAAPNVDIYDPEHSDDASSLDGDADLTSGLPGDVTPVIPAEPSEALVLTNVGDSRTYLFRHQRLRPVTVDHSYVQELVATGHLTHEEARNHPRRNIVTRALGIEPDVKVDWWTLPLIRGDRFLLCSDGLVDEVDDDDIRDALAGLTDPQEAADRLVEMANDAGGRDNITVIVLDVLDGDDPPDPTVEVEAIPVWADDAAGPTPAGTLEVDADPGESALPPPDATPPEPRRRRKRWGWKRFLALFVVAVLLVVSFVLVANWARSGFFVAFDEDDEVIIWKGQTDGFLWFDPTRETPAGPERDELTEESVVKVEERPRFDSRAEADEWVRTELELEETGTDDDTGGTGAAGDGDTGDPSTTDPPSTNSATEPATTDPASTEPATNQQPPTTEQ